MSLYGKYRSRPKRLQQWLRYTLTSYAMRYFDLVLTPEHDGIHPVDAELAVTERVEREALLHIDSFGDGTGVLLYRLHVEHLLLVVVGV